MTLPNTSNRFSLAALGALHGDRGFSPTDRQLAPFDALLGAPCPPNDHNSGADRLTLPGRGDRRHPARR